MLPVTLSVMAALLIEYWSLSRLHAEYEQSNHVETHEAQVFTEAARLSADMASVHRLVTDTLENALSKGVTEADIYLVHAKVVDDLAAINKGVIQLSEYEHVRYASFEDVQFLRSEAYEYSNFVIMATDIAAIDPNTALKHVNKAQKHFIAFSTHAYRIAELLGNRTVQRITESKTSFHHYFIKVLMISLLALLFTLALATILAKKTSLNISSVADALMALASSGELTTHASQRIVQMCSSSTLQFREMAQAVLIFRDALVERKESEQQIHNLAFHDVLTQLPNRRLLLDRLSNALLHSARTHLYGAVLFLDVDKFKNLNDTMGHKFGDMLLINVGQRLQSCVRESDTVARLGGDEFVLLIEELDDHAENALQKIAITAEKIRESFTQPFLLDNKEYLGSTSIGVCLYRGTAESAEDLIKHADVAMYKAKESGRNAVRFFDPEMQATVEAHALLELDLRHAIAEKQLSLYYQIQVDSENRPIGAEALVRWIHPVRGMVSPAQFIPLAEESSLILSIGDWVLDTACRQLSAWSKSEKTRNLTLAVNISAEQFKQSDFVETVSALIHQYEIDASLLKLELTEGVVLNNVAEVISKMHALIAIRIKLSLDDFGTGYSSLSYLKQLPLDQIKIDQSFVRDMTSDQNDAVMIQTIISLAKNFRLNVIAEGVETETQLTLLKSFGCMAYQGYLFSKPVPIDAFESLL
jgi:diguanylate cyclase (GGDEF)-like protein